MNDCNYYIDDCFVTEAHFWNAIQGMLRPNQMSRLFNGEKVIIGGISYQIIDNNKN